MYMFHIFSMRWSQKLFTSSGPRCKKLDAAKACHERTWIDTGSGPVLFFTWLTVLQTSSNSARTNCRMSHESALDETETHHSTAAKSPCVCRSSDKNLCHSQGILQRVPLSVWIKLPHPQLWTDTKLLKIFWSWQKLAMMLLESMTSWSKMTEGCARLWRMYSEGSAWKLKDAVLFAS